MHKLKTFLSSKPFFLYLLPVFFVLHGFMENAGVMPVRESFVLLAVYLIVAVSLAGLFWLFFKNRYKASLLAFCLMAFNFFFGSTHDLLKKELGNSILVKYSFILPAVILGFAALVIYIQKSKRNFKNTTKYLNALLVLLILIDTGPLIYKVSGTHKNSSGISYQFRDCTNCPKPDIYLIVADEYAGKTELKELFSFDNSHFENELKKRGFHITPQTKSNYNSTVYSMASMLTMGYLRDLESDTINHSDMFRCRALINKNPVFDFLGKMGYSFFNYTFFDIKSREKAVTNPFFITKYQLFTSQTFVMRIQEDIGFHFASYEFVKKLKKQHFYNNRKIDSLTRINIETNRVEPKFVYTHLAMPHHPYYTDSNGKEVPVERLTYAYAENKEAYIEYLIYTNKKLLELVDLIQKHSQRPTMILLMSDHGFRQFSADVDKKYNFMNLNAVSLPGGNYTQFYESMSNVNQFRVILNSQFGQNLPLLKDSSIYLNEAP